MFTYDDILKKHAYGVFHKHAETPDDSLFIGEAERLCEQENIQLELIKINPVSKALIDPNLDSVEDMGIVGDGLGIVSEKDMISGEYPFGNPLEEVF